MDKPFLDEAGPKLGTLTGFAMPLLVPAGRLGAST